MGLEYTIGLPPKYMYHSFLYKNTLLFVFLAGLGLYDEQIPFLARILEPKNINFSEGPIVNMLLFWLMFFFFKIVFALKSSSVPLTLFCVIVGSFNCLHTCLRDSSSLQLLLYCAGSSP